MNARTFLLLVLTPLSVLFAQPMIAPSPDRTTSTLAENASTYNITNSFELGYRFALVGGDASFFRNTENLGNGLRLFGANFTANSKDGHGVLFDSLTLTTQGLGNDPYSMANLHIEKNEVYRYDMSWRKSNYLNLPLDNGAGANLMNTSRDMQDHDLTISAAKWAKIKLGYSRISQTGLQDSNYEAYIGGLARSVLPILQNVRRDYDEYRSGVELNFLGFRFTASHQWEYSKDDTTTDPLTPGDPYERTLIQPYQPALPVTYPPLVTAYMRSQPMHGMNSGWFGNLSRTAKYWALNARMTYNEAHESTFYFEQESGASAVANSICSNCAAGAPTNAFTFMPGTARRPFTSGELTLSVFPTSRLSIVHSTSAQNMHEDGAGLMWQVNYVAAVKNAFWNYRIGDQRFSDAIDANYKATSWLALNAEARYTARWLINNLIRTGTTNSKDLNTLNNHMDTGTLGFRVKPLKPLSLTADGTLGRDNAALTPIAPAHFHNIRARADYREGKRLRFGVSYRQVYNLNAPAQQIFTSTYGPPPASYYSSHTRDMSANSSVVISRNWSLDVSYNKLHLDTFANLWAELPLPNSPTIVSVPGYVSRYVSNIHTVSVMARTTFLRRGTLYLGYNLTRDAGDGRLLQNLGLTDPAAAYLAGFNTFPMTYQSPMARLSIKVLPNLQWNAGWQYYGYNQQFAYFGYQPGYRAETGYTSVSWSF